MGMPPAIETASLGWEDSLILMAMALVVFGPRRLPEIGRQIGRLMYEIRKASSDFKVQIEAELRAAEEADWRRRNEQQLLLQTAVGAEELSAPPDASADRSASRAPATDRGQASSPATEKTHDG
ncbi:MAG: twin-arginine translocase TatA/TatE family subunit [Terracidiphilus sp.]